MDHYREESRHIMEIIAQTGAIIEPMSNAGIRDQFRLNQFPPAGGNGTPPTPPAPAPVVK